jgi:hypothetical protein
MAPDRINVLPYGVVEGDGAEGAYVRADIAVAAWKALARFGRHTPECPAPVGLGCDCGWAELRARLRTSPDDPAPPDPPGAGVTSGRPSGGAAESIPPAPGDLAGRVRGRADFPLGLADPAEHVDLDDVRHDLLCLLGSYEQPGQDPPEVDQLYGQMLPTPRWAVQEALDALVEDGEVDTWKIHRRPVPAARWYRLVEVA